MSSKYLRLVALVRRISCKRQTMERCAAVRFKRPVPKDTPVPTADQVDWMDSSMGDVA